MGLVAVHPENKIVSTKSTPLELNSTFDDFFSSRFSIYLISVKRVIVKDTYHNQSSWSTQVLNVNEQANLVRNIF